MTDAARGTRVLGRTHGVLTHPVSLWAAFVLVHLVLGLICLTAPSLPMGDVTIVYEFWMRRGVEADIWVGLDTAWVYPLLAIVPMLLSAAFGWTLYASTWLTLALLVDAAAFVVLLIRGGRRRGTASAAWWWVAFLAALGPIALGRIDTFATALAIVGVLTIVGRPVLGTVLLTVGAWIKVWPAALVAASVIALRSRLTVLVAAIATTAAVLVVGLAAGGGVGLVSFITEQSGRGLQIESPLAMPAMWAAWAHAGTSVYYDQAILTYQLDGPGTALAAALSTPLLALAVGVLTMLGLVGARRGRAALALLPPLMLALTMALIVFNKVGSPQFIGWIAVPVIFGIVTARTGGGVSFRTPAVLALAVAVLTQLVYPYWYGALLGLDTALVVILTVRNILSLVLLVWAVVTVVSVVRKEPVPA